MYPVGRTGTLITEGALAADGVGKLRQRASRSGTKSENAASYLWARAIAADGRTAEAWVRAGEGHAYTARSAVGATPANEPLGAATVARTFGTRLSFMAGGELVAAA